MSAPRRLRWTPAEYFDFEAHSLDKHEFLDGEIFAMAGARSSHNLVATNTLGFFVASLRGRPCKPFNSDQRIHISRTGLYTYPDGGVACGDWQLHPADDMSLLNPVLLFEVLSLATADYDRGAKLEHYQAIPSLQEVLLIDQPERRIEHHRRDGDRWLAATFTDGLIELALGVNLPLAELYDPIEAPSRSNRTQCSGVDSTRAPGPT